MPEFNSSEDWVNYFKEKFPRGILATFAIGDPEVAGVDSSPQHLCTKAGVEEFDEYSPTLFLSDYDTGFPMRFVAVDFLTDDPERMVIQTDEDRYLILSSLVSDQQAEMVEQRLEGGIFS